MLPPIELLRVRLRAVIDDKDEQGHATGGLTDELVALPASYDALAAFAERLTALPMRVDWPYVEPDALDEILAECDPARPMGALGRLDPDELSACAGAAFVARVCGCMLGKPFEIDPTMEELRAALEPAGEWPLRDYLTERGLGRLRERQGQWPELVRERIDHVAPDDDINYTIIGMLLLEQYGLAWTRDDLRATWLMQLPARATFGPERTFLTDAATHIAP